MIQVGDEITFKVPWGEVFAYTRNVKQVVPGGVRVLFMGEDFFVPAGSYRKMATSKTPRRNGFYHYIVDLDTNARVSYSDSRETPIWKLLARLTKQYPERDFGFRSTRRRPEGDTTDRLDVETLHIP